MYTELKSYQIIIALLKKWGIKHCVLSPGSRNVPFVHSVEVDPFFHCYSVVDERSAAYFALGLAQELNEPVVISCTSSTATCNYWPAVAEAYYLNVPLIVLTSDRNPAMLGHLEDQMIDQVGMYDRHVKKSVNLPIVEDKEDFIYCQRLVNEALLELNHNGMGPVHINVPMKSYNTSFNVKELPEVTKIERLQIKDKKEKWNERVEKLKKSERVLVIAGQNSHVSSELKENIEKFFKKFNCAFCVEYMGNIEGEYVINPTLCMETRYITAHKFKEFLPDIVITFGGNFTSGIKDMLRKFAGEFEHWLIKEDGKVVDVFKSLNTIFECTPEYFFEYFNSHVGDDANNNLVYHKSIKQYHDSVIIPEFKFSNIYAIKEVVERIPSNSILHLSINNSIRITNFFKLQPNVKVYANIGTFGIDGCLSSFLGQAVASGKLSFLIIGDLSFFYDMNAIRIKHIGKNVRILMINNQGGGEFYFNGSWKDEASDLHTTARHHTEAGEWVKSVGFTYLPARDKESFLSALDKFFDDKSDKPIFMEVFTEMKNDCDTVYEFFDLSRPRDIKSESIRKSKELIKKTIGQETAQKIANIFRKD